MDPLSNMKSENSDEVRKSIGVIGAGSFGTALAEIAARAGNHVKLFARNKEVVDGINSSHKNPHYFPDFELSPNLEAVDNAAAALTGVEFVILAIPTQSVSPEGKY